MNRQEIIEYCLSFPGAYEDYPGEKQWTIIRHGENKKGFAYIFERRKRVCISLKCDPDLADFFRQEYDDVVPGCRMNKVYWNTVYIGGDVPEEELYYMIQHSFSLIKPKLWQQNRTIAENNKIWPNNFYFKLYGQNYNNTPDNAEEAIEYVLNMMQKREKEVVLSRFRDYKKLAAIGLEQGISSNRVGQVLGVAFRKMRHPVRSRFLLNLHDELEKDRVAKAGRVQLYAKMCAEERLKALEMVTIRDFNLSVRAHNCLSRSYIQTLADLSKLSLTELRRFRNLGPHTCEEIMVVCEEYGVKIE